MDNTTERILFTGHVQGVGFRWTTQGIAARLDVTGYVKNLPTGQVELVVSGSSDEVERLLADLSARFEGHIERTDREKVPEQEEFSDFRIRH